MASPRDAVREVIRSLVKDRKDLEDEIREIDITIRRLRKAFPDAIQTAELPNDPVSRDSDEPEEMPYSTDRPYVGMSNPDAAKAYLEATGEPKKTSEVRKALKRGGIESEAQNFHSTVYTALKRLADDGKIRDLGGGVWAPKGYESDEGRGQEQEGDSEREDSLF